MNGRRRDAASTKGALLRAAGELFGELGYAGTTLRDIAERAGVDPALIARYFGSKAALYVASIEAEPEPHYEFNADRVRRLIERSALIGPAPIFQAAIRPVDDETVREASHDILRERLVDPMRRQIEASGLDRAALRADVAIAALTGVLLARSSDIFDQLCASSDDELTGIVMEMMAVWTQPAPPPTPA